MHGKIRAKNEYLDMKFARMYALVFFYRIYSNMFNSHLSKIAANS